MNHSMKRLLLFGIFPLLTVATVTVHKRGERPQYFTDASTTKYCTWYHDNSDGSTACRNVPDTYGVSWADFLRWNPVITESCSGYNTFQSYCVEAFGEPPVSVAPSSSRSTQRPTSTSAAGNGITTPQPTQPGMTSNCNKFYFVKKDQGCNEIASLNGITFQQLYDWNTGIGTKCEGLWADVNICVGAIGYTPAPTSTPAKSTSRQATSTAPTNGVQTPTPTQPGMVSDCDRFYYANEGDGCQDIANRNSISLSNFVSWNPGVKSDCSGLWANVWTCVRVIGYKPPTTTTVRPSTTSKTGNGVTTPTPTQAGMVSNCNKFYYVNSGDTCDSIAKSQKITVANFVKWNPAVKSDCTGLWANTNACVGVM